MCTVCASPKHERIDVELAGGATPPAVARRYQLSTDALRRHKAAHLSPALVKAELESVRTESGRNARDQVLADLLAELRAIGRRADRMLDQAEDRRSFNGAANLMREARGCLELVARLEGVLDDRPQTTVVNVLGSPELAQIVNVMLEATAAWPEARIALADRLEAIEVSTR